VAGLCAQIEHGALSVACGHARSAGSADLLRSEHVELLDDRRARQEMGRLCHQRLRDRAGQVGLAGGIVGEGVEDGKAARPDPERKPDRGRGFLAGELESLLKERGDLGFLTRLGFETYEQGNLRHETTPFECVGSSQA
jgi:hypothetical protein